MSDTLYAGGAARRPGLRPLSELLSSMRFAIALLTVICIASVIGTVLKQHEPAVNYVNQFGPFWAELFLALKLNAVYSAWWFLLILAFLVVSTSLCVARHTPKYLADIRNYKENIREKSLQAFGLKAQADLQGEAPEAAARRVGQLLASGGWRVKLQERQTPAGTGWMVAAMTGSANKIGYIAAHSAIVLICLGGLLDGDLIVRAQMWLGGKTPYTGGGLVSEVAAEHRLGVGNPTFRGDLFVSEGTQSSTAVLSQSDGVLLQELPFAVELKKFIVDYYPTGMPKLFSSEIVIHDLQTGEQVPKRVEVNHPANYKGVEIYQSSFDDGGSRVRLRAHPLIPGGEGFDVSGVIGRNSELTHSGGDKLTLELASLRVINVENFGGDMGASGMSGADVRKVDLRQSIESRLGAGNKTVSKREMRNVGPSITYRLRDASGQAREFHNYMAPIAMDDAPAVYLLGVRESQASEFRYLRVPMDAEGGLDDFVRLRRASADEGLRAQAVARYAARAVDPSRPDLREPLAQSAARTLALFAGARDGEGRAVGGLQAVAAFLQANVPEAERERAAEVVLRIMNGTLLELVQLTRAQAGLAALPADEKTRAYMTQLVFALSDGELYPAPLLLELKDFDQVQASVFQVARAPGKNVVYLGCALLILGVFAMLYVRQRRLWVWLAPRGAGSHATMAMSSNRKTMDGGREFAQLRSKLLGDDPDGGNA